MNSHLAFIGLLVLIGGFFFLGFLFGTYFRKNR